jgi:hypothetical protein
MPSLRLAHPAASTRSQAFRGEPDADRFLGAAHRTISRTLTSGIVTAFRVAGALRIFIACRSCCAPESVQGETEHVCAEATAGSNHASRT